MQIREVVLYLGQRRLKATVQDGNTLRRIKYSWTSVDGEATPPPKLWLKAVTEEVRFQKGEEYSQSVVGQFT